MRSPQKRPMRSPQTDPMRSPQKRPMQSPQTEPTRWSETDPMRALQTGAHKHVPWAPPVELNAEGQALRERLPAFRTQALGKNTTFQRAIP